MVTFRDVSLIVMERLCTVESVISALGGNAAACRLAGIESQNAPSNWKGERGRIPAEYWLIFSEALRLEGKEADPAVFGLKEPMEARP